eukprot:COSAG01_NODE_12253_length_1773_cov_1.383513_2_plen_183_part_00
MAWTGTAQLLSGGGCPNRRHPLVNCDHGGSIASRFGRHGGATHRVIAVAAPIAQRWCGDHTPAASHRRSNRWSQHPCVDTSAGGDHGIDSHPNRLRFPLCDPMHDLQPHPYTIRRETLDGPEAVYPATRMSSEVHVRPNSRSQGSLWYAAVLAHWSIESARSCPTAARHWVAVGVRTAYPRC